jgi:hypothetical protein
LPDVRLDTLNVAWWQEPEDTVTATALTYIVAQEHINDLRRQAERHRRVVEVRAPQRVRLSIPRALARRATRTATA